jgi:magnesium-transporting ATPase (P-type)
MTHNSNSIAGAEIALAINEQVRRVSMDTARRSRDNEEDQPDKELHFVISHGLSTAEANELLKKWGRNELVEKSTPTWIIIFRLVN